MYELYFEIPALPKPTNRLNSLHWTVKGKLVKEWHEWVRLSVGIKRPTTPLVRAALTCIRYSSVCPDYDGLVSSFKHVIDGLVVCGVLEDDSMAHIGMPSFLWHKVAPKKGAISVTVMQI